jgi:hydrogenase maturation protease
VPSILAVGNSDRGDDGVGPYVLAGLARRVPGAALLSSDGEVSGLLEIFASGPELVLVDAADARSAGLSPGEVLRLDADDPALAGSGLRASTHALGVAEAIALGRSLGVLPRRLTVIAIAGSDFSIGTGLSAPVESAAIALIDELEALLIHA